MKSSNIGGQAVIEGVMMKNKDRYAVAVRKPDGEIEVTTDTYKSVVGKYTALTKLSFVFFRALSNIFNSQWKSMFNTVDTLMLRAMIAIQTLNIVHYRNSAHIGNKNRNADDSLNDNPNCIGRNPFLQQI